MKLRERLQWSKQRTYLLASPLIALLSLAFSFVYSRDLGPQNRGVLGVIFLANVLFTAIALGGLNLTFRSHQTPIDSNSHGAAFCVLSGVGALSGAIFVFVLSSIYSLFKSQVPSNLLFMAACYALISIALNQSFQILLSINLIGVRWKLDLFAVFLQLVLYFSLDGISAFSTAVNVLLSFIFSYIVNLLITLVFLSTKSSFKISSIKVRVMVRELVSSSRNNFRYAALMGVLDRVDRLIVLVLFPTATFGFYAFTTGLMTSTRFFPESISAMVVAGKFKKVESHVHLSNTFQRILILVGSLLFGIISYKMTIFTFKTAELISITVPILFAFSEILRGAFVTRLSFEIGKYESSLPTKAASLTLILFIALSLITFDTFGLTAVPLVLGISYATTMTIYKILKMPNTTRDKRD